MKFYKVFMTLLFLLISQSILSAQDSLYLITTITGNNVNERITNISVVGDINRDGYNEFTIMRNKTNYFDIYFGVDIFATNNKFQFPTPKELTGSYNNIPIGDINNDGFDDFFIPGYIGIAYPEGRLYIYFGSQEIDTSSYLPIVLPGFPTTSGDMDGDGKTDLITSNPAYPLPTNMIYKMQGDQIGEVYLHLGSDTVSTIPSITFKSDSANDGFGYATDISGDLNGDGFNDLLVIAPLVSITDSISKCYVYLGAEYISDHPYLSFQIYEGSDLSYVGDVNGDRYDDFLISEGLGNPQLYFGSENFSADNFIEFSAYKDIDDFGVGFSGLGDINNDGYDDFAINILNYINNKNIMVGKLNIYLGGAIVDTIPDFSLEGETKWSEFGRKVGGLGDLNGDGYDEIYVLADGYPNFENPLGKLYIYSMKKFVVGVEKEKQTKMNQTFKLYQNYPNPFNPSTTLSYSLPSASNVKLIIYDVMGRMIKSFTENSQSSGTHKVVWDGTNSNGVKVSTGIYIYRFEATSIATNEHFVKSEKLMLVK